MDGWSAQHQKLALAAAAAVGLGVAVAFMKDRRAGERFKTVKERESTKFHVRRNTSQAHLASGAYTKRENLSPGNRERTDSSDPRDHPEGLNVGFGSSPSWTDPKARDSIPVTTDMMSHEEPKLVIVMLGFPGSGKTNIAMKVARYLRWNSYRCRVFSLAKYRLDKVGNKSADFFDPENTEYVAQRQEIMKCVVEDAIRYMKRGGNVVVIDGTNTTRARRETIRSMLDSEPDKYRLLFIETKQGGDSSVLQRNVSDDTLDDLLTSPDFLDQEDYEKRLAYYKKGYEPLADEEGSSITIMHGEKRLVLHQIFGFIPTKIVSFVMNLHKQPRTIYLCRHGESEFNARGLIGGDTGLTPRGQEFSSALAAHMATLYPKGTSATEGDLTVWTSIMRRARDTASQIQSTNYMEWRLLRDLEVGTCDGLSYKQIQVMFPEEYRQREQDKLRYRYPRGESYLDLINRLEPLIFEIERQRKPVVVVAHQAVLRCLYAYFLDLPENMLPHLSIPLHTIIKLEPAAHGCKEKRLRFVLDADNGTFDVPTRERAHSSWEKYHMQSGESVTGTH